MDTKHADMRIEIVKRELSQGALAGFDSTISDYGAMLVLAALDSFDAAALDQAHRDGYRDGFEAGHRNGVLYERGKRRRPTAS